MRYRLEEGDIVSVGGYEYKAQNGTLIRLNQKSSYKGCTPLQVRDAVCKAFGVTADILSDHSREVYKVRARKAFCYFLYNYAGLSTIDIARLIDRKHPNVIHLKECWQNDMQIYAYTKTMSNIIHNTLK